MPVEYEVLRSAFVRDLCYEEGMLETSARLLRLLSLFQGRRYWSGADLAGRLEITARTLRRDVDKLRALGYPVHSTPGVDGGYQLGAGSAMPPLLLDDEEAIAVALGLRCAAAGSIGGIEEASVRALAKIEQMLPARLGKRASALYAMIVTPASGKSPIDVRTLSIVAAACRDQQMLRFRYRDHSGTASARSVEPHRLVHNRYRWYLVAWDAVRRDWRTFRVDRIQPRLTTGLRFFSRQLPAPDLAAYVSRGASYAPPCRARVKLMAPADVIASRLPPGTGLIEPLDAQSCLVQLAASSFEALAFYVGFMGADFEVIEPPELMEHVRRLADRYVRATAAAQY